MNRSSLKVVVSIVLLWAGIAAAIAQDVRKTLALNSFKYNGDETLTIAFQDLETMLRTDLTKSQRYKVLDRSQMGKQVEEMEFGRGGLADPAKAKKFGKILSSDFFVCGTVVEARKTGKTRAMSEEYSFSIDLAIIEVETGASVVAEQIKMVEYADAPQSAVRALAGTLVRKILFGLAPVKVVSAKNSVIVLNYGRDFIQIGQIFDVFVQGAEIKDPDTGVILGREEELIGQVRVTSAEAAFCKASENNTLRPLVAGMVCRMTTQASEPVKFSTGSATVPEVNLHAGRPKVVVGKFVYSREFDLQQNADRSKSVSVVKPSGTDRGAVLGAVAGGVAAYALGNQSAVQTIGGALAGGIVGDQVDRQKSVATPNPNDKDQSATSLTKESQLLQEMVVNRFAKIDQFEVVERTRIQEVKQEIDLLADGKFDVTTIAQEGKLAGADYLVFGTISHFSTDQNNTGMGFVGGKNKTLTKLRVELRLVDVRTGSIKLADSIEGCVIAEKSAYTFLGFGVGKDEEGELGDLFDATAVAVVSKVITTVRPIIAMDVNREENSVVLNYGEGIVAIGDQVVMFQVGEEIKDPYTGQVLGKREKTVATLQIVDVQPRFSKGQVIAREKNIQMADLVPGMVCRVQKSVASPTEGESTKPAPPVRKPTFTF